MLYSAIKQIKQIEEVFSFPKFYQGDKITYGTNLHVLGLTYN